MLNPPLDQKAFALRPVRMLIKQNEFRHYEALTFPENPFNGCSMYLRRCFSDLKEDGSNLSIDVLDENGDIIQEYPITRKGFNYLRMVLKFKVACTPSNKLQRCFSEVQRIGEEVSELSKVGWKQVEYLRQLNFVFEEAMMVGDVILQTK